MRKMCSIVVLLCLLAPFVLADDSIWFKGTFDQAKLKAEQENKLLLIDFYSDG